MKFLGDLFIKKKNNEVLDILKVNDFGVKRVKNEKKNANNILSKTHARTLIFMKNRNETKKLQGLFKHEYLDYIRAWDGACGLIW